LQRSAKLLTCDTHDFNTYRLHLGNAAPSNTLLARAKNRVPHAPAPLSGFTGNSQVPRMGLRRHYTLRDSVDENGGPERRCIPHKAHAGFSTFPAAS